MLQFDLVAELAFSRRSAPTPVALLLPLACCPAGAMVTSAPPTSKEGRQIQGTGGATDCITRRATSRLHCSLLWYVAILHCVWSCSASGFLTVGADPGRDQAPPFDSPTFFTAEADHTAWAKQKPANDYGEDRHVVEVPSKDSKAINQGLSLIHI